MTKQTASEALAQRVADEIRAEMARQRRSAADLAEYLGITAHTVGRRLNGAVPFNVIELASVSVWLGVPIFELIARATSKAVAA
ncbi:helix-turn-helix domain-containing protein [Microbacterium betulae]|uniref:Helix-turn-helix domain-containing protein n=1 Tax=Microbacterium betulae TaxID=2981139 RepID=A0AA97FIE1_9MICO|nr:helix-turn-helix domain-containing protein [Microbacterium sp. AB]WOF23798.1 helix-turn-helix domain-containing protein [Microbacterium sp. AB]